MDFIEKMKNANDRNEKGKIEFLQEESGSVGEKQNAGSKDDLSFFQFEKRERSGKVSSILILALVLAAVYFFSLLFVIQYDRFNFSFAYIRTNVQQNITDFMNWIMGNGSHHVISMKVKQYLIITLVGAALSAVGAMFKSIFRNILAAPTTMGVQEGGILGNLLFLGIFGSMLAVNTSQVTATGVLGNIAHLGFFQNYGQQIFIFGGCFFGIFLVALIGNTAGGGHLSTSAIVLAGTVVNGAIAGITGAVQYYVSISSGDDDLVQLLLRVTMGSFETAYRSSELYLMLAVFVPSFLVMYALGHTMNLFSLGDEEATAMGVNVRRFKLFVIILGTFLTAITMMYCGHIAFIGLIVPQFVRKMAGPDFRKLLPASILMGGIVMLLVYDFAVFAGMVDGLSMITTVLGCVMLMAVLLGKRGDSHAVVS